MNPNVQMGQRGHQELLLASPRWLGLFAAPTLAVQEEDARGQHVPGTEQLSGLQI